MAKISYYNENNPNDNIINKKIYSMIDYNVEEDIMSRKETKFFFNNLGKIDNTEEEDYDYDQEFENDTYL